MTTKPDHSAEYVAADHLAFLRRIVDEQAEDEGLWFIAQTCPEAYLQQELRRLHAYIECATGGSHALDELTRMAEEDGDYA